MEKKFKFNSEKHKALLVGGIMTKHKAFTGPEVLHIDLTNHCNMNCIACWCRSPLLGEKEMPDWEKKLTLPYEKIKEVFDDVHEMGGLKQVKLVGGGEPFMHPDIINTVAYIKNKDRNIEIDINTNFSLVNEDKADKLIALGLDSFTVSLWAGSPQAYASVHPNQNAESFKRIEKVLRYISSRKKALGKKVPRVMIHNVVFKQNYSDFSSMLEFALDVGSDGIQFVPVDVVKEKTESLLLNEIEKNELLIQLQKARMNYDPRTFVYTVDGNRLLVLPDFDGFIERIGRLNIKSGAYDKEVVAGVPCYVGWLFARIMATGNVVPCCKGHRMIMGNIHENRFKEVWHSKAYRIFRKNGLRLPKSHPYFLKIGNDADKKTGCYNCDNLWQIIPMHREITNFKSARGKIGIIGALFGRLIKR